ncbi:MAG TPA: hypothetical protein DCQ06_11215, partial [Myxococcales bacterium]|nr:hypothetical protein [Myxococcales bacterium]
MDVHPIQRPLVWRTLAACVCSLVFIGPWSSEALKRPKRRAKSRVSVRKIAPPTKKPVALASKTTQTADDVLVVSKDQAVVQKDVTVAPKRPSVKPKPTAKPKP